MEFSRELRESILSGDITVTFRLWQRPKVKLGGRYRVGDGRIESTRSNWSPLPSLTTLTSVAPARPTWSHYDDEPLMPVRSTTKQCYIESNSMPSSR